VKILLVANTDWYLFRFRLSLAKFLRAQGMDVVFASPSGQYVSSIVAEGFRHLIWEIGRRSINPLEEALAIGKLANLYRLERPDIIHLHTIKPVLYGSLAARLTGSPAVVCSVTGRGYVFLGEGPLANGLRPLVKGLYRFALRHGNTLFENEADREYFLSENLVKPEQTHLIEGVGVDTDYYQPLPEPSGIPTVLMAARMLWDKGVGTLVKAARLMQGRTPMRVVLVGKPDPGNPASIPEETLNEWAKEGAVEWWGFQADIRNVFSSCHIVALPSLGEGIPTVLLEAAACGRALVATNVPGCRDVVVDGVNGLLVPPKDPQALAEALIRLLKDKALRETMGAAARKLAVERFSDQRVNAKTLAIYQSIAPR